MKTWSADFFGLFHNNSWASLARYANRNAPIRDVEPCLLCSLCTWFAFEYIFEIYLDTLAWISFAKFEINFRNPLIGCQCFDFVCPKARSVHPNWHTRSNFVHPESRSVRPGCNDVLWIQRWLMHCKARPHPSPFHQTNVTGTFGIKCLVQNVCFIDCFPLFCVGVLIVRPSQLYIYCIWMHCFID